MSTFAHSPQFTFEGTITFGSVANSTSAWPEQTITLPSSMKFPSPGGSGGVGGGLIYMSLPNLQTGLAYCNVFVASPTTFKVRFFNATGGALTPTGTSARLVMF